MSAINKFRIVGVKYNHQERFYKDEIFIFSSEEGPYNVINTAKNSFGKGVYLQVLFQAMIPKTPWSRGKNTVNHFFYADKGQFRPYTFYSCLEFYLSPGRSLLVGIAITSKINEKNDCEPVYTLFVREYSVSLHDPFTIGEIPLYDKQKDRPTPYSDFVDYLKTNKKEFLIFNENSKSKFYKHLESYGIMKKDWEQLIDINQYEGGVAQYFDDKKATRNHGLFSQMIIPAIEARLNDKEDENHLINLFKNIASITKNLPELKKNASSYAEIKGHNEEVNKKVADSIEEKESYEIHLKNGLELVAAVKNETITMKKESSEHLYQLEELKKQQRELVWKQENIKYVEKHEELTQVQASIHSLENELTKKEENRIELQGEQNQAALQLQIRKWHEKDRELQDVRSKIHAIEQSEEFRESKDKLKQLESHIHDEWDKIRNKIQRTQTESVSYKNYVTEQRHITNQQLKEYNANLIKMGINHGVLEKSIKQFEADLEEPKKEYGEYFLYETNNLLSTTSRELLNSNRQQLQYKDELEDKQKEKVDLGLQLATIKAEIKATQNDKWSKKEKQTYQEKKEKALISKVWKVLRVNPVEVVNFRRWLQEEVQLLKKKKEEWEITFNRLNLELYELAFEMKQNDNPYLIPSEEVYKVKTLLTEKGIPAMYGDEYIKQQEQSKRKELNTCHPLLKYGLLIPNHNKNFLEDLKKLDKRYFHAPVPIYWVNQLSEPTHVPFTILDQVATDLSIYDEKLLERKKQLYSKGDEIRTEIDSTKAYLNQLTSVIAELEAFDSSYTSAELQNDYEVLQKDCLEKEKKESDLSKEISNIDQMISNLSQTILTLSTTHEKLKKEIDNLESWITKKKTYEDENQQQYQLSLKMQSLESKISLIENQLLQLNDEYQVWTNTHYEWNKRKEELIDKVKEIIPVIHFDEVLTQKSQKNMPILNLDAGRLNDCLNNWDAAQMEISLHDLELAKLRTSCSHHQKNVTDEERKLSNLNIEWRKYSIPLESITILEKRLDLVKINVKEIENNILKLNLNFEHKNIDMTRLVDELKDLLKRCKSLGKQPELWQIDDYINASFEVQEEITRNSRDIIETEDIIKELTQRISEFNRVFDRLEARLGSQDTIDYLPSAYIQEQIKKEPEKTGDDWIQKYTRCKDSVDKKKSALQYTYRSKKEEFEKSDWTLNIKELALKVYEVIDFNELHDAKATLESLSSLAENEIREAEDERNTAEEAKKEWVDHTCKYALQIVEHLRKMVKAMIITNRNGLKFPLVKLKGEKYLPKETDQIRGNIDDLFDSVIKEIFAEYQEINDIPLKVLKDKVSTKNIIFAALNYQYPTLRLYRLHEENSFLYEPPKEEFYTDWETINESSKTDPSGSGGQLFSARTLLLMMLTSFKRSNEDNSNWKLLITDNPFSVAVSDHIVDPILAIAEELKFQWIVVTPPELVKIELLQKFDVHYHLSAKDINNGTDQVISEVQYGYRNYKKSNSILREDKRPILSAKTS